MANDANRSQKDVESDGVLLSDATPEDMADALIKKGLTIVLIVSKSSPESMLNSNKGNSDLYYDTESTSLEFMETWLYQMTGAINSAMQKPTRQQRYAELEERLEKATEEKTEALRMYHQLHAQFLEAVRMDEAKSGQPKKEPEDRGTRQKFTVQWPGDQMQDDAPEILAQRIKQLTRQMTAEHPDRNGNAQDFKNLSAERDRLQKLLSDDNATPVSATSCFRVRKSRAALLEPMPWKLDPMTGAQENFLLDLQKRNGHPSDRIDWRLIFTRDPPKNKGNAGILIEYWLDIEALGRTSWLRYQEMMDAGICTMLDVQECHSKTRGLG